MRDGCLGLTCSGFMVRTNKPPHGETGVRVANVGGISSTSISLVSDTPSSQTGQTLTVRAHVSEQRLLPYMDATFNDAEKAVELYLWDRRLATAIFHDLSVLEVALRNALDRALTQEHGSEWFRLSSALFDQRTYSQIADAWERLPARFRDAAPGDGRIRGRLLASCMFGTWVSALDAGGKTGVDGPCAWSNHDVVWTRGVLLLAFPGAGKIAGTMRTQLTRPWVHQQVREVHILRNRVAHHESLINGYPVPGTGGKTSAPDRRTVQEGTQAGRRLGQMIDIALADLIENHSQVDDVLAIDPRIGWGFAS